MTTPASPAVDTPVEPGPPYGSAPWHVFVDVDGEPYPTRHRSPDRAEPGIDLSSRQLDYLRAVHEAGHAIAVLLGKGHLHSAEIVVGVADDATGGEVRACNLADGHAYAVFSAAGERAADRWLREAGLWTPARAVANEVGARGDRQQFLAINPHVGFGDRDVNYRVVHDLADQALDPHWTAITRVADQLAQRGRLDAAEITKLAGLRNGQPSTKCEQRTDWWEEDPTEAAREDRRYWADRDED